MPMSEEELQIFIDSITNYFDQITGAKATVETPYLRGKDQVVQDFTGVIGISGKSKGAVYYTASRELLVELLTATVGEEPTDEWLLDLVGEVANTLSGNARKRFGANFMISVPVTIKGAEEVRMPETIKSFVIPITWQNQRSYLIVCLEQ
jgi:chemotaxis protein CheX